MHFYKNIFEKPIAKKLSLWYNTAVMKNAGVAQWQSSGIVNRRLQVRLLSPAPNINATLFRVAFIFGNGDG